jgi:hypothetical protein
VKALESLVISHGLDIRLIASASSDGEVKTWTIMEDGSVAENGSYDTGNRLLCLVLHDAAVEQQDSLPPPSTKDDSDFQSSSEESEDVDENEWNGIGDA